MQLFWCLRIIVKISRLNKLQSMHNSHRPINFRYCLFGRFMGSLIPSIVYIPGFSMASFSLNLTASCSIYTLRRSSSLILTLHYVISR